MKGATWRELNTEQRPLEKWNWKDPPLANSNKRSETRKKGKKKREKKDVYETSKEIDKSYNNSFALIIFLLYKIEAVTYTTHVSFQEYKCLNCL